MATTLRAPAIGQGDLSPVLRYQCPDGVDLTGASVVFSMWAADRNNTVRIDEAAAAIVQSSNPAIVEYEWASGDTDYAGLHYAHFRATYANTKPETFPAAGKKIEVTIGRSFDRTATGD